MTEESYKKKYENLKEKYETLQTEFKSINNELYYIKVSRSYKLTLIIRKLFKPLRKIKIALTEINSNFTKIKRYTKDTEKIAIIPCSFEFDEYVNQRPINYAKYLADRGYKVLYVVWQWNENTKVQNAFKEVYKNIMQIPLYSFIKVPIEFENIRKKIFYINFPNQMFTEMSYNLRANGFIIHYDIMDEWEEFKKVGQADWFKKNVEEKFILESDCVTAVSPYLIEKYNHLRKDIKLIPNGFYEKVTGTNNKNISLKNIENNIINIGYFGHLTDSWFDWNLIFEIAKANKNYRIHIIGYGMPEKIQKELENLNNIVYYGKIPTTMLYQHVKNWNIGIIPFKESNLAKAVDPIKIYEYLYMGLPVIVSGIEHLESYPMTNIVKNADEFKKTVEEVIAKSREINIDEFLENSTWEARFKKFTDEYELEGMNELYEK